MLRDLGGTLIDLLALSRRRRLGPLGQILRFLLDGQVLAGMDPATGYSQSRPVQCMGDRYDGFQTPLNYSFSRYIVSHVIVLLSKGRLTGIRCRRLAAMRRGEGGRRFLQARCGKIGLFLPDR